MVARRVIEEVELAALWTEAAPSIEPGVMCDPTGGFLQPPLESLLRFGMEAPRKEVYGCYEDGGPAAAYAVISTDTGECNWLVILGPESLRQDVVAMLFEFIRLDLGKSVFGVVRNKSVRDLFDQPGATISAPHVTWIG